MNERFEELAKQAGAEDFYGGNECMDLEKFAKLIVQECADICQQVTNNGMFDGDQQYASAYCRDEIKRYFGVKE